MQQDIASQQFHLEDIFEEGWRVFKSIFAKSAPIVIVFGFVTNFICGLAVQKLGLDALVEAGRITERNALKIETVIDKFFTFLIFSVAIIAVVKCAEKAITRRDCTASEALGEGVRRWPSYLWTSWLGGVIIGALCLLLIVPGLIWAVYYAFVPYVVSVTSLSGKKALDYSKSLVKGAFWRTIGYLFVIGVAASIPTMILAMAGNVVDNLAADMTPSILAKVVVPAITDTVANLPVVFQLSLATVFFLNTAYLKRGLKG